MPDNNKNIDRTLPPMVRYAAFISYNHHDRQWAKWLHKAIETYKPPVGGAEKVANWGHQLRPVFLDREELPTSSDLASSVKNALRNSDRLIVICSPSAAQSKWVNEEISLFVALGRRDYIHCLVVAGDPATWSDVAPKQSESCFPEALRKRLEGEVATAPLPEPLAADVRPGMDDRESAKLKIVAAMLGVRLDDLRQRHQVRRQKRLVGIAAASSVGALVLAALSVVAVLSRNDAQRARLLAEQKSRTAERTAEFLQSLFAISDPSESRGNSVTAREILDRGVKEIETQLRNEPEIRAELLTTLGGVYSNLGLYKSSDSLLSQAADTRGRSIDGALRNAILLAETKLRLSEYESAGTLFREAGALALANAPADDALAIRINLGLAETLLATEQTLPAIQLLQSTMKSALALKPANIEVTARVHAGLGEAYFYSGSLAESIASFSNALASYEKLYGDTHPKVSLLLGQLGSAEYMRGNRAAAEQYYEKALQVGRRILGNRHPELAISMNNLARVYLERRNFERGWVLLEQSRDILLEQKSELHDDMVFVWANLGLASAGLARDSDAQKLLQKALRAARENKHRLLGPVLTDLAKFDCAAQRFGAALERLREARPLMAARYPDDPWRSAIVDSVEGGCWMARGDLVRAAPLLTSSAPIVLAKWQPNELYGYDTVQLMIRFYTATGNTTELERYKKLAK